MSDDRIQKLAKAVAEIIRSGILDRETLPFKDEAKEQELLVELAQAMVAEDQEKAKTIKQEIYKL